MWAALRALFASTLMMLTPAFAYTGTFYADFGSQSKDQACQSIIRAFKATNALQPYPAECLFIEPGHYYGMYHTKEAITLQFKHIDGSIYEMVYDIPNEVVIAPRTPGSPILSWPAIAAAGVSGPGSNHNPAVATALERAEVARRAEYERMGPPCRDITVTGLAAALSVYFAQIGANSDIDDLLARNPLLCSESASGQSIFEGHGLYNPTYIKRCRGLTLLEDQQAKIIAWDKDFYTISTNLDFNTGFQQVTLYIRREDARCFR